MKLLSIDVMNIEQWHCQSLLMLTCKYKFYEEQTFYLLATLLENISTNENLTNQNIERTWRNELNYILPTLPL